MSIKITHKSVTSEISVKKLAEVSLVQSKFSGEESSIVSREESKERSIEVGSLGVGSFFELLRLLLVTLRVTSSWVEGFFDFLLLGTS